jgi:hypothetical protein
MALVRLFPPIVREPDWTRSRAANSYWRIVYNPAIDGLGGTLCQERYEIAWKWRHPFRYRSTAGKQDMEIMGHAVEIAFNVRWHQADYDWEVQTEAADLMGYPQFAGVEGAEIMRRLRDAGPAAVRWLDNHPLFVGWALEREAEDAA